MTSFSESSPAYYQKDKCKKKIKKSREFPSDKVTVARMPMTIQSCIKKANPFYPYERL